MKPSDYILTLEKDDVKKLDSRFMRLAMEPTTLLTQTHHKKHTTLLCQQLRVIQTQLMRSEVSNFHCLNLTMAMQQTSKKHQN